MSLGERIRQMRQTRGLTQQQLGGGQLSKSFISLVERDRTKPSVDTLVFFARQLGTSVDGLLGQDGHVPEMAAGSLLSITSSALASQDYETVSRLLGTVEYLAGKFRLDEAGREMHLQRAEAAIEQREFAIASSTLAAVQTACEHERDHWRLGRALMLQGRSKVRQREYLQAADLLEASLAALRRARAGRDPARVHALILLGTALTHTDRLDTALRRYQEAADAEVTRHDAALRGRALWGLGWVCRRQGRMDDAKTYLAQARDAFESAEELPDLMRVLHNLGQIDHEQGRSKEALRHFHHALRVVERLQRPATRAAILTEIGRVHFALGEHDEAEHFVTQALEETRRIGDPVEAAEARVVLSHIQLARGETRPAVEGVRQATATFRERGMQTKAIHIARDFGLALKDRGAHAEAAEFLALVAESSVAGPDSVPPVKARR